MRTSWPLLITLFLQALLAVTALGQSGIQWSGSAKTSIERATEMGVPIMFWVTQRTDWDDDAADDLKDAQRDAFRDPVVLAITERYFVPCAVSRNSRVIAEAEKLGLPTNFGLYIAIVTPTGQLLDQIDPGQVASPEALAERLAAASRTYRDSVYNDKLKAALTNPAASKQSIREAVRAVWRMRIYSADQDIVALLSRPGLTPDERARLYQLLAAFGTAPCVDALLDAAADKSAAAALVRAEPAALPTLLQSLPPAAGEASARQLAAYRAATSIARVRNARADSFWTTATTEERAKELERVTGAAQAVFDSWQDREGRWR